MASVKVKFSIGQELVARKSGKTCTVVGFYADKSGVSVDAQAPSSKRAWRFREDELMTPAEAAKAAKAKEKAKAQAAAQKVKQGKVAKAVKAAKAAEPAKAAKKSKTA